MDTAVDETARAGPASLSLAASRLACRLSALEDEVACAHKQRVEAVAEADLLRKDKIEAEKALAEHKATSQADAQSLYGKIGDLEGQVAAKAQENAELQTKVQQSIEEVKAVMENRTTGQHELQEAHEKLQHEVRGKAEECARLAKRLANQEQLVDVVEAELRAARSAWAEVKGLVDQQAKDMSEHQQRVQSMVVHEEECLDKISQLREEAQRQDVRLQKCKAELAKRAVRIADLTALLKDRDTQISGLTAAQAGYDQQHQESSARLQRVLDDLQKSHQGAETLRQTVRAQQAAMEKLRLHNKALMDSLAQMRPPNDSQTDEQAQANKTLQAQVDQLTAKCSLLDKQLTAANKFAAELQEKGAATKGPAVANEGQPFSAAAHMAPVTPADSRSMRSIGPSKPAQQSASPSAACSAPASVMLLAPEQATRSDAPDHQATTIRKPVTGVYTAQALPRPEGPTQQQGAVPCKAAIQPATSCPAPCGASSSAPQRHVPTAGEAKVRSSPKASVQVAQPPEAQHSQTPAFNTALVPGNMQSGTARQALRCEQQQVPTSHQQRAQAPAQDTTSTDPSGSTHNGENVLSRPSSEPASKDGQPTQPSLPACANIVAHDGVTLSALAEQPQMRIVPTSQELRGTSSAPEKLDPLTIRNGLSPRPPSNAPPAQDIGITSSSTHEKVTSMILPQAPNATRLAAQDPQPLAPANNANSTQPAAQHSSQSTPMAGEAASRPSGPMEGPPALAHAIDTVSELDLDADDDITAPSSTTATSKLAMQTSQAPQVQVSKAASGTSAPLAMQPRLGFQAGMERGLQASENLQHESAADSAGRSSDGPATPASQPAQGSHMAPAKTLKPAASGAEPQEESNQPGAAVTPAAQPSLAPMSAKFPATLQGLRQLPLRQGVPVGIKGTRTSSQTAQPAAALQPNQQAASKPAQPVTKPDSTAQNSSRMGDPVLDMACATGSSTDAAFCTASHNTIGSKPPVSESQAQVPLVFDEQPGASSGKSQHFMALHETPGPAAAPAAGLHDIFSTIPFGTVLSDSDEEAAPSQHPQPAQASGCHPNVSATGRGSQHQAASEAPDTAHTAGHMPSSAGCACGQPDFGLMISCRRCSNRFHAHCSTLVNADASRWTCERCSKLPQAPTPNTALPKRKRQQGRPGSKPKASNGPAAKKQAR